MSTYTPPIQDMIFVLNDLLGFGNLPEAAEIDSDMLETILGEAGRLAAEEIAPLNHTGDQETSRLVDGNVVTPKGFKEAYAHYRDNGWNSVPFNPDFGGQGMPWSLAFAVQEMWQSANLSFGLCPLLNQGAVEAIDHHGSDELKSLYLEKLISGQWTGTMNLTEPQAGSDLSVIKTKAEPQGDGTYKITGQKIFITYGDHDMAENIIHLVLARLPDAPEGTKGISLFIVPKFLLDENGNPGERNDVVCASLEHKLGIHASPTCVMVYGDKGGATGYLVGEENQGLKYMFTMMNNARLSVGLQGVAVAERAYQHALAYAEERVQGTKLADKGGERVVIAEHADVKRMLMLMKSLTEAGRALAYDAAMAVDRGDQEKVNLLTPIVKSWCTDLAQEVTYNGVQIWGGMGFVEESGAAQYYRDARILPIYEGTNGIQSLDLVFRKTLMDGGKTALSWIEDSKKQIEKLEESDLKDALQNLEDATKWILETGQKHPDAVAAVSVPYLNAFGYVAGGLMLARQKLLENSGAINKSETYRFYLNHILPRASAHMTTVMKGSL